MIPEFSTQKAESSLMTAMDAFTALAQLCPKNALLVQETCSNSSDLVQVWPAEQPESYFTFASGGLGWNAPAAVGIALAQKYSGTPRPTIFAIGDGSFQYSVQSIYTAVQHKLKLIYLVPINDEYAILKNFAVLARTPNVPALDLPGLNAMATAKSYGCPAFRAENATELQKCFEEVLKMDGPALIEFPIDRQLRPLVAQTAASMGLNAPQWSATNFKTTVPDLPSGSFTMSRLKKSMDRPSGPSTLNSLKSLMDRPSRSSKLNDLKNLMDHPRTVQSSFGRSGVQTCRTKTFDFYKYLSRLRSRILGLV